MKNQFNLKPYRLYNPLYLLGIALLLSTYNTSSYATESIPTDIIQKRIQQQPLSPTDNARYSMYLASNCINCHNSNVQQSKTTFVPLSGLKAAYIIQQMNVFKNKQRPSTLMHQIAKGYNDEQIKLIAAYFEGVK